MSDPHEDLVEAVARKIYEECGYDYDSRTIGPNGPYGNWALTLRSARVAIDLIAERTKDATPEMRRIGAETKADFWEGCNDRPDNWMEIEAAEVYREMHRASALWPKEKP